jgi:DNA-binding transcriptional MerR regulator
MAKEEFIRKEVATILDMKPHTIQLYTDRGIVTPDVYAPVGRGTRRKYSKRNLLELAMTRELGKKGISLAQVKTIIDFIREAEWFNTELSNIGKSQYYLMIYDHDTENKEVSFSQGITEKDTKRQIKHERKIIEEKTGKPISWHDKRALKERLKWPYRPNLNMKGHMSVVVLNITVLWGQIARRL